MRKVDEKGRSVIASRLLWQLNGLKHACVKRTLTPSDRLSSVAASLNLKYLENVTAN